MGWGDSGTYGHELIQTPNLDKLASQGVKFTQCYAAAGVCSPSRSAILTGRTPYRNGVWRHLSGNGPIASKNQRDHLPQSCFARQVTRPVTWENGTSTHGKCSTTLNSHNRAITDTTIGFTLTTTLALATRTLTTLFGMGEPLGETGRLFGPVGRGSEAERWLEEDPRSIQAFCACQCGCMNHTNRLRRTPVFESLYEGHPNSKYMGNVTQLDHALGTVMDALDSQKGLGDQTLLIFTSDNGPEGQRTVPPVVRRVDSADENATTMTAASEYPVSHAGLDTSEAGTH